MILDIFLLIIYSVSIMLFQTTIFECRVKNKIVLALLLLAQIGVAVLADKLCNLIFEEEYIGYSPYIGAILGILCMSILPVVYTKGSVVKRFICAYISNLLFLISIPLINEFAIMCYNSELLGEEIYLLKNFVLMMLIPYFIILLIQARIWYVVNERRNSS